ncbi:MAG: hypothetical protein QXM45_02430, partial [Archaeoglobaceae archaeon]
PEVKSVFLMAGSYDLSVLVEGKTLKEVAGNFVILEKDGNSYEIKKDFSDEDFLKELENLAGESVG